LSVRYYKKRAI